MGPSPAGGGWSMLAKNLPPAERSSWDQPAGSRLDCLLVSFNYLVRLGWGLTLERALAGHGCSSKREDRGDREE
jgi:hypothetical protein